MNNHKPINNQINTHQAHIAFSQSGSAQGNPDAGSSQSLANAGGHALGKREVDQAAPQAKLSAEEKAARAERTEQIFNIYNQEELTEQDEATILLLAQQGIAVNKADGDGCTPLYWAAYNGHSEVVQLLLGLKDIQVNKNDRWIRTPLYWAALKGHKEVVQLLLNVKEIAVNKADNNNNTPLYWAAYNDHREVVQLLLDVKEIAVNKADKNDHTPLHGAASQGHTEMVCLLLKHKDASSKYCDFGVTDWPAWLELYPELKTNAIALTLAETNRLTEVLYTLWIVCNQKLDTADYWNTLRAHAEQTTDLTVKRALQFFIDYQNISGDSDPKLWEDLSADIATMAQDADQARTIVPLFSTLRDYFEASDDADMQAFFGKLTVDFGRIVEYSDRKRTHQAVLQMHLDEAQSPQGINLVRILRTQKGVASSLTQPSSIQYSDAAFAESKNKFIEIAKNLQPHLAKNSTPEAYVAKFGKFWSRILNLDDVRNSTNKEWYHRRLMLMVQRLSFTNSKMGIEQNIEHLRSIAGAITGDGLEQCKNRALEVLARIELEQDLYRLRNDRVAFLDLSLMALKRTWITQYVLEAIRQNDGNGDAFDAEWALHNMIEYAGVLGLGDIASTVSIATEAKLYALNDILKEIWRQDNGQFVYLSKEAIADGLLNNPSVRAVYTEIAHKKNPEIVNLPVQFEAALKELRISLQADYTGKRWIQEQFKSCIHKFITLLKIEDIGTQDELLGFAGQLTKTDDSLEADSASAKAIGNLETRLRSPLEAAQRPIEAALKDQLLADLEANGYIGGNQDAFDWDTQALEELALDWVVQNDELPAKLRRAEPQPMDVA